METQWIATRSMVCKENHFREKQFGKQGCDSGWNFWTALRHSGAVHPATGSRAVGRGISKTSRAVVLRVTCLFLSYWKVFAVARTHRKREARTTSNPMRILPLFVGKFPRNLSFCFFPISLNCLFEKAMAGKEGRSY